jgi:hypothetical protein
LPAYCAVAMAGLGWLPDTILTRSVIVRMRRRAPNEMVEPFRRRIHMAEALPVYEAVESWARTITKINWPDLPSEIQDRDADVWESLVAIADVVGGDWPDRARKAAIALVDAGQDAGPSLGILLLSDIKAIFHEHHKDSIPSKELVQKLIALEDQPWGDIKGKPLDERSLARRLRAYSIKPSTVYAPGRGSNPKGYTKADFHDAWGRYVDASPAPPGKAATSATSATIVPFQGIGIADGLRMDRNVADTIGNRRCSVCNKPGDILQCSHGGDDFWAHAHCIDRRISEASAETMGAEIDGTHG